MTDELYLAQLNYAVALRRSGRYKDALGTTLLLQRDSERRNEPALWHTIGQIMTDLGEFDEALEAHERAVDLYKRNPNPDPARCQTFSLGLATALMRYGRFSEAWPHWEAGRLMVSWSPWPGSEYLSMTRLRSGEPVKSVLVQHEGGYGDLFMFLRWIPVLRDLVEPGAKIGLMLHPASYTFCNWKDLGVDTVYRIGLDKIDFGSWKYATSIMSLPTILGMQTWNDVSKYPKYWLGEYHARRDSRRDLFLPDLPFRLGFCWRAEENTSPVRTKSLPPEVAGQVCALAKNRFNRIMDICSLSPVKSDLYNDSKFDTPRGMNIESSRMTDWRRTAEYIASMDFVLTVDTAVAHLAGLLGVPALVLLPKSSDWRWGLPGENPPWYGPQLTYYRQPVPLEWDAGQIVQALMERIN